MLEVPQSQRRGSTAIVLLLVCLTSALPSLLADLHQPHVVTQAEANALVESIHTWRDMNWGSNWLTLEPLTPNFNGQLRVVESPGLTWTHLGAFGLARLAVGPLEAEGFILTARLASVVWALLAVAAVFWAGRSMGNNLTAVLSSLLLIATPGFTYYGRQATGDIVHLSLAIIAIAAALWAIRPLRAHPSLWRQGLGWGLTGLAFAGALMTAGPVALLTITLPITVILFICPGRLGHLLGAVAAFIIGLLFITPWVVFIHTMQVNAWRFWLIRLWPDWADLWLDVGPRLAWLGLFMLPWTVWVFVGLAHPLSASSKGERPRLWVTVSWLLVATLGLMLVPAGGSGGAGILLPILPAAAVLIAQMFSQYAELASEGRYAKSWRRFRWVHLTLLLLVSTGAPVVFHAQVMLKDPFAQVLPWPAAVGMAVALLSLAFLSVHFMLREYPGKTMIIWCAWSLALMTASAFPLARGPLGQTHLRQQAKAALSLVDSQTLYWLDTHDVPGSADHGDHEDGAQMVVQPDAVLLLYADRRIPALDIRQLVQATHGEPDFYLLAPPRLPPELAPRATLLSVIPNLDRSLYRISAEN